MRLKLLLIAFLVLFASPVFAAGLTLSLSDPELGSFVLKKENPLKETGGGLGGLSIGEYTYNGESIQFHLYRGNMYWDGPTPRERWGPLAKQLGYAGMYQVSFRIFDKTGYIDSAGGDDFKYLPPYERPKDNLSKEEFESLNYHREALYMKLVELFKQNFRSNPDWWPEMYALIIAGRSFEALREFNRRAREHSDNLWQDGHLAIEVYKGNAFEFPSGILGEHSASIIYRWDARSGYYIKCGDYPNHGRYPKDRYSQAY